MKYLSYFRKQNSFLLIILAVLTTVYLLTLGYYNSWLLDDYAFLANVSKKGFFG